MKKWMLITSVVTGVCLFSLCPQSTTNAGPNPVDTTKKKKTIPIYLGTQTGKVISMPQAEFDALMKQGIHGQDSLGNKYTVANFLFGYGERALYEDSVGNLMVMTDYISDYCDGDTLNIVFQRNRIFDRTKAGDTAYFDEVKVYGADGKAYEGRPLRVALTK